MTKAITTSFATVTLALALTAFPQATPLGSVAASANVDPAVHSLSVSGGAL